MGGREQRYHQETWPPAAGPWETRWWKRETEMGSGSIASDICHPHPWLPCSTLKSFLCLGKVFENYFHEELSEGIPQTPTQWRFMWPEADCISKVVLSHQSVGHTRNASMIPGEQREKRDNTNVCSSFSSSCLLTHQEKNQFRAQRKDQELSVRLGHGNSWELHRSSCLARSCRMRPCQNRKEKIPEGNYTYVVRLFFFFN